MKRRMSLPELLERFRSLGGASAAPVVSLEAFFEGNDDRASIGCNLTPHPGVRTFERVLHAIRARPGVADVVVQLVDDMGDSEWPFSDRVYVITTTSAKAVHEWAAELSPDPWAEDELQTWLGSKVPPPGAPLVPEGFSVVCLFWD